MFTQQSSILINSLRNSAIQGQNEPSSSLPSWLDNARTPMQYEDEKANSFRSQSAIPAEGFGDKNIDSRYYSASNVTDTECLKDNWRHENLDAPNHRNIDVGGRLNSDNSYYQRLDYGHGRRSPTTFDNATDRPFPKDSNSGLQRKEYLTNIPAINDDELFRLFEDGLDVMVQSSEGIQAFMDFDPELRSFFLPIFKDHDLDAVIQVFGHGEESVAVKKLEEMVLLIKNKIQHLCTEIAETISIRSKKEAEQKSRRFAKPVRLLNNRANPVDQREDDLKRDSDFHRAPLPAIYDAPRSDTLIPKHLIHPLDDHRTAGLLPQSGLRNFPQPIVPLPPLLPLGMPLPPLPHLGNMVPPFLAAAAQGNGILPLPIMQPLPGIPTRPSQGMPAANPMLLPKEKPRLVEPAAKKGQKAKYPPCLKSIPLLPTSNTKTQSSNNSESKIKTMDAKKKSNQMVLAADTTLLPIVKPCSVEPAAKKAKTTKLPSLFDSITPLSKFNANNKTSNNSLSQTNNSQIIVINPLIKASHSIIQRNKIVYVAKHLNAAKKLTTSRDVFLNRCFNELDRTWLHVNYAETKQGEFLFGSLSIDGVFITRQKALSKLMLWKLVHAKAYDVLRNIPADMIIEFGDPNADGDPVLREEKFALMMTLKKIKDFIITKHKVNHQPNIQLTDINRRVKKSLLVVSVTKKLNYPEEESNMAKVMQGHCHISLEFASTAELAAKKANASAIHRFKSLSLKKIAYEVGLKTEKM